MLFKLVKSFNLLPTKTIIKIEGVSPKRVVVKNLATFTFVIDIHRF